MYKTCSELTTKTPERMNRSLWRFYCWYMPVGYFEEHLSMVASVYKMNYWFNTKVIKIDNDKK